MTVELPIFSELESAWFATTPQPESPHAESPQPGSWPPEPSTGDVSWRSVADDGWRAAAAAAAPQEHDTTDHGLPRRVPMAQLVPGGVETPAAAGAGADRRTPDSVRGLLSAYHRGVQRGREAGGSGDDDGYTSGKEQEA
jgi:hypothetical protein